MENVAEQFWCQVRSKTGGSESVVLILTMSVLILPGNLLEKKFAGPPRSVNQKLIGSSNLSFDRPSREF